MNRYPSHSQTPEFDTDKSQTTSFLYRQPKAEEMRPSRRAQFIADLKDFALFVILAVCFWVLINIVKFALFGV